MNKCKIMWHKLVPEAVIPTKRAEDAGFDIYTIEKNVHLNPHQKKLFSTGLAAAVSEGYWLMGMDRGSTGSRGLHIHCGVIDNGYRGEIFICLCNDNDYPVVFTDELKEIVAIQDGEVIEKLFYPTSKAIAQLIPIAQPDVESYEVDESEFSALAQTERGASKLGASGK